MPKAHNSFDLNAMLGKHLGSSTGSMHSSNSGDAFSIFEKFRKQEGHFSKSVLSSEDQKQDNLTSSTGPT